MMTTEEDIWEKNNKVKGKIDDIVVKAVNGEYDRNTVEQFLRVIDNSVENFMGFRDEELDEKVEEQLGRLEGIRELFDEIQEESNEEDIDRIVEYLSSSDMEVNSIDELKNVTFGDLESKVRMGMEPRSMDIVLDRLESTYEAVLEDIKEDGS